MRRVSDVFFFLSRTRSRSRARRPYRPRARVMNAVTLNPTFLSAKARAAPGAARGAAARRAAPRRGLVVTASSGSGKKKGACEEFARTVARRVAARGSRGLSARASGGGRGAPRPRREGPSRARDAAAPGPAPARAARPTFRPPLATSTLFPRADVGRSKNSPQPYQARTPPRRSPSPAAASATPPSRTRASRSSTPRYDRAREPGPGAPPGPARARRRRGLNNRGAALSRDPSRRSGVSRKTNNAERLRERKKKTKRRADPPRARASFINPRASLKTLPLPSPPPSLLFNSRSTLHSCSRS